MPLTPEHQALVHAARDLAHRVPSLGTVAALARATADDVAGALLPDANREAEKYRPQGAVDRDALVRAAEEAERQVALALERAEAARALDEAARKVDAWLVRAPTVQARVDEARASLWRNKLDWRLRDRGQIAVRESGRQVLAQVDGAASAAAWRDLAAGTRAWVEAVLADVRRDLDLAAWEAWTALDRDLPASPPLLGDGPLRDVRLSPPWPARAALPDRPPEGDEPRDWWVPPAPPTEERGWPRPAFWAEFARTLRMQVFPIAAVLGIAGIARSEALALAVPVIIPVAVFVVNRDRRARVEKLEQEALKAVQDELVRWAEGRMERNRVRIRDHVTWALQAEVRPRWIAWYRAEVQPRRTGASRDHAASQDAHRKAADAARKHDADFPLRELDRFRQAAAAARPREGG